MSNLLKLQQLIILLMLPIASACMSSKPAQTVAGPVQKKISNEDSNLLIKGAPDWVNKGSYLSASQGKSMFHGVASAAPMGDLALQKAVADDGARAEVVRILSLYLDVVVMEYNASIKMPEPGTKLSGASRTVSSEAKVLQQILKGINPVTTNTRIISSWRDPRSNHIWSLAELDIKHVLSAISSINDLNIDLKRYIEAEAGNIYERVSGRRRIDPDSGQ